MLDIFFDLLTASLGDGPRWWKIASVVFVAFLALVAVLIFATWIA